MTKQSELIVECTAKLQFMEWDSLPNIEPLSRSYESLIDSIKNRLLEDYQTYVTDRHIIEIIYEVIKFSNTK